MHQSSPQSREQAQKQEQERALIAALFLSLYPVVWTALIERLRRVPRKDPDLVRQAIRTILREHLEPLLVNAAETAAAQARWRVLAMLHAAISRDPRLLEHLPESWSSFLTSFPVLSAARRREIRDFWEIRAAEYVDAVVESVTTGVVSGDEALEIEELTRRLGVGIEGHVIQAVLDAVTHQAYQDEVQDAAEDISILQGFEYVSRRDSRVRPTHRDADGKFAPVGDDMMLAEFDRLLSEWGCRCAKVPIFGLPGDPPVLI